MDAEDGDWLEGQNIQMCIAATGRSTDPFNYGSEPAHGCHVCPINNWNNPERDRTSPSFLSDAQHCSCSGVPPSESA